MRKKLKLPLHPVKRRYDKDDDRDFDEFVVWRKGPYVLTLCRKWKKTADGGSDGSYWKDWFCLYNNNEWLGGTIGGWDEKRDEWDDHSGYCYEQAAEMIEEETNIKVRPNLLRRNTRKALTNFIWNTA